MCTSGCQHPHRGFPKGLCSFVMPQGSCGTEPPALPLPGAVGMLVLGTHRWNCFSGRLPSLPGRVDEAALSFQKKL